MKSSLSFVDAYEVSNEGNSGEGTEGGGSMSNMGKRRLERANENPSESLGLLDWILTQNCRNTLSLHN